MTSRMPVGEIIADMMLTNGAVYEYLTLYGRMPTRDELAYFKPKYAEYCKARGEDVEGEADE